MTNTTICVLFCLISVVLTAPEPKKDCVKLANSAEQCFKEAVFLGETKIPKNEAEATEYGKLCVKSLKCLRDYRVCHKGLSRQIYGMVCNNLSKYVKQYFGKNADLKKTLSDIRCFDDAVLGKVHKCFESLSVQLKHTATKPSNVDVFPYLCCTIQETKKCVVDAVKSTCKNGKEQGAKFMEALFSGITGDVVDFACSKQPTVAVCESSYKDVMTDLRADHSKYKTTVGYVLKPLVDVADKLSS